MKNTNLVTILVLTLIVCACYDISDRKIDPNLTPRILVEPRLGVSANGVDTLRIKFYFPIQPVLDCTNITFKTTQGIFLETNKSEYSTNEFYKSNRDSILVLAKIKSTINPGMYFLTVDLPKSFRTTVPITFLPSYPKTISTDKNKFAVKASFSEEIQLLANVKAARGLPSMGTEIEFVVDDKFSSKTSKWFRGLTTTNSDGQASVLFSPAALENFRGSVKYKAIFRKDNVEIAAGNGEFELID